MAWYVNLTTVKSFLWITVNTYDTDLSNLIDYSKMIIDQEIWGTLEQNASAEDFFQCSLTEFSFILENVNPYEITSINNESISSYISGRIVSFERLPDKLTAFPFWYKIKYKSWFTIIPKDIEFINLLLIKWMYEQSKIGWVVNQNIESFRQWELQVNYTKSIENLPFQNQKLIKNTINKYKITSCIW